MVFVLKKKIIVFSKFNQEIMMKKIFIVFVFVVFVFIV